MISVEINLNGETNSYEFPTGWEDVTLDKYQALVNMSTPENMNELYIFEIIESLTGIKKDILFQMSVDDFKILTKNLNFIHQDVPPNPIDNVEIDGETYYLHTDFNKYTAGEIITIDTILKQHDYNYTKCLTDLLCVFLRKKVNDEIEAFTTKMFDRKPLYEKLKITDVNKIFGFFFLGKSTLDNNTKDYLVENDPK